MSRRRCAGNPMVAPQPRDVATPLGDPRATAAAYAAVEALREAVEAADAGCKKDAAVGDHEKTRFSAQASTGLIDAPPRRILRVVGRLSLVRHRWSVVACLQL